MNEKSKKLYIVGIILIVIGILLIIFFKKEKNLNPTGNIRSIDYKSAYYMSGNDLQDFDLYFLNLEYDNNNIIYSPLSIKYALQMLAEGADGDTLEQINAVIGDYTTKKYTNSSHISLANALFVKNDFKNADVINKWVSDKTFGLIDNILSDDEISELDFGLLNALAIDMNWVNRLQASEYLSDDLSQIIYNVVYTHENYNDSIRMIDSIYNPTMTFNGKDNIESVEIGATFNRYDIINELGEDNIRNNIKKLYSTYLQENTDDECKAVDEYVNEYINDIDSNYNTGLSSTDFYLYTDDSVKVFAKDLQEYDGTTLQYVGIMPIKENLSDYIQNTNSIKLSALISKLKESKLENFKEGVITKITGSLPLFSLDYGLNLMNDLKTMGINDVFLLDKANLSKFTSAQDISIVKAAHKANIEFSNDGIKASAVTLFGGAGSARGGCGFDYKYDVPVEVVDITFDKPYMFIIRDKGSGEVWFTGAVYNP